MVYDIDHSYSGPTESHFDFWVGYGRELREGIYWRIQLNNRDAFAKEELVPISTQPDGTPAAYRIPEPRSWSITNTISL